MPLPLTLSVAGSDFDIQGALILLLFLAMIALMYTRKISALLALPILGVGVALIGAVPWADALEANRLQGFLGLWETLQIKPIVIDQVMGAGALKLHRAYTIAIIGGMLAIMIKEKRIAETLIKFAAELSGDNPYKVAFLMMIVIAMLFTSMGGLGAIIMTGTIVFPIMMSLGIPPLTAAGIYLISFSAGGTLNPGNWALYEQALGLAPEDVQLFAFVTMFLYFVTGIVFIFVNLRGGTRFWATAKVSSAKTGVRPIALLAPVIPIVLAFKFSTVTNIMLFYVDQWLGAGHRVAQDLSLIHRGAVFWDANIGAWDYTGAFAAGLLFTFVATYQRGRPNIQQLTKAMIVGAESVTPAVLLMLGLGVVLEAMWIPSVQLHLAPYIERVVPASPLTYVIIFTVLAPMALYRGPLNVWGLGLGVAALIYGAGTMGALPIMAVFMSVGAIQSVCDPTNTHTIWIASYIGEDTMRILKKTIGYVWVMAACGLIIASIMFREEFGSPLASSSLQTPQTLMTGASGALAIDIVSDDPEDLLVDVIIDLNELMGSPVVGGTSQQITTSADGSLVILDVALLADQTKRLTVTGRVTGDPHNEENAPRVVLRPDRGAMVTLTLGQTD